MKSIPIVVLVSLFLLSACNGNKNNTAQVIPEVKVVAAGQGTIPVYAEFVGQTYGASDIELRPRVEGWVQSLNFKEGGQVKKGQLLYVIQDDELRDREQAAMADLAQANVLAVKAKADLDRVKPLTEMNALSKRDLDAAQASYDAQLQSIIAAKAALSNARTQLSYSRMLSPIDGTIGVSRVHVGDYVSKGVGEAPLNTISAVGEMRIRFSITENDYLRYSKIMTPEKIKNLEVEFILNDGSVFPEKGKVDFTNREVDAATGSLLVQALVPNKTRLLRPGQYVKVRFKSDEIPNAVLVPQEAINQMQNVYMAYLVNDSSKINPRPVKASVRAGSNWVITEGIKPGEKVALVGNALVRPGMVIKPVLTPYSYDSTLNR